MLDEDDAAELMAQSLECAFDDLAEIHKAGGKEFVSQYIAHINAHGLYEYKVEVVLMPDRKSMN